MLSSSGQIALALGSRSLAAVLCASVFLLVGSALPFMLNVSTGGFLGNGWPIAATSALTGVAATTVWLLCWNISGRIWPAYVGLAIYPAWVLAEIGASRGVGAAHRDLIVVGSLVPAVLGTSLVKRGLRAPEVDSGFRPSRVFAALTAVIIATVLAGGVAWGVGVAPVLSPAVVVASGLIATLFWALSAARCACLSKVAVSYRIGMAASFIAFAVSSCDRAMSLEAARPELASWAMMLARLAALVAFAVLLLIGWKSLCAARLMSRNRQQALREMRDRVAQTLENQTHYIQERRHDLRSLVAGIAGATTTLTRYRQFLNNGEQRALERALGAEIARLQHSVGGSGRRDRFNVGATLRAIVIAERTRGTPVVADLLDVDVLGSGDSIAALVQNLITNARCHAPGATIRVVCDVADGLVRIAVQDDGPGLSDDVRRRVTELFHEVTGPLGIAIPAQRRADSRPSRTKPGHDGLGLAICARLAHEQEAGLRLADAPVGTRVEVLLRPAANTVGMAS